MKNFNSIFKPLTNAQPWSTVWSTFLTLYVLYSDIGDESVKSARYFFEDPQSSTTKGPQLLFTGHPTAVLGTMQLHCRFGPNRHQKRIDREQQEKAS